MAKQANIESLGTVVKASGGGLYHVELENGFKVLCHLNGKMKKFKIRILPGDDVTIEMSPYDLTKGRIILRR
jgi:translation initiation factor IF-1